MKINNKGITLVSLIITIVIMLILAGVSISFIIGQNGLFTKSKDAAEISKKATTKEDLKNKLIEVQMDYIDSNKELTLSDLKEELVKDTELVNKVNGIMDTKGEESFIKYLEVELKSNVGTNYYINSSLNTLDKKPEDAGEAVPEVSNVLKIYDNGVEGVSLTDEFQNTSWARAEVSKETNRMKIHSAPSSMSFISTVDPINWTEYKTFVVKATPDVSFNYGRVIFTTVENTRVVNAPIEYLGDSLPNTTINGSDGKNSYVMDISNINSSLCMAITAYRGNNDGYIYEIYATEDSYSDVVANFNN